MVVSVHPACTLQVPVCASVIVLKTYIRYRYRILSLERSRYVEVLSTALVLLSLLSSPTCAHSLKPRR